VRLVQNPWTAAASIVSNFETQEPSKGQRSNCVSRLWNNCNVTRDNVGRESLAVFQLHKTHQATCNLPASRSIWISMHPSNIIDVDSTTARWILDRSLNSYRCIAVHRCERSLNPDWATVLHRNTFVWIQRWNPSSDCYIQIGQRTCCSGGQECVCMNSTISMIPLSGHTIQIRQIRCAEMHLGGFNDGIHRALQWWFINAIKLVIRQANSLFTITSLMPLMNHHRFVFVNANNQGVEGGGGRIIHNTIFFEINSLCPTTSKQWIFLLQKFNLTMPIRVLYVRREEWNTTACTRHFECLIQFLKSQLYIHIIN